MPDAIVLEPQIHSSSRSRPGWGAFLAVNGIGGTLVLASYAWGFLARPDAMGALWGGVPEAIRPLYTVNMLLAAAGYFLFAPYLGYRLSGARAVVAGVSATPVATILMVVVLAGSALWLPLTVAMVDRPGVLLWWLIRADLAAVGIASVGLLLCALRARPREPGRTAAVLGAIPFSVQTALLDATIWPLYFPAP